MTTANDITTLAASQIGQAESPRGSNRQPYGRWMNMNGQPWCAMFVSWVFAQRGLPLPAHGSQGFAYCPDGVNWFKRIGAWHSTPRVGDVVFYNFTGGTLAEHVGIVELVNSDGAIVAIEGNTNAAGGSNGELVMRKVRRNGILGYGRPKYTTPNYVTPNPAPTDNTTEALVNSLPTLKQGSTGQHVKIAQGLISANGRPVGIDGDFGPGTATALRNWQRAAGITADGVIGPVTWQHLLCV